MSQPRESSIVNRRPGVRGHRPFPLDPLATGRRTGTKVALAPRNSDGVEDFREILRQLDSRQIKPQNVPRKKSAVHIPLFDMSEDEYQMENNSTPPPASGFKNASYQPSSIHRGYPAQKQLSSDENNELPRPPPRKSKPVREKFPEPQDMDFDIPIHSSSERGGRRKSSHKISGRRGTPAGRNESDDEGGSSPEVGRRLSSNAHLSARMPRGSNASMASRKDRMSERFDSPRASVISSRSLQPINEDMDMDMSYDQEEPPSFADLARDEGGSAELDDLEVPFAEYDDPEPELEPVSVPISRRKKTPEPPADEEDEEVQDDMPLQSARAKSKQRAITPVRVSEEREQESARSAHTSVKSKGRSVRSPVEDDEDQEEGTPTPTARRSALPEEPVAPQFDFPEPEDYPMEPAEPATEYDRSQELDAEPEAEEGEEPEPEPKRQTKGKKGPKKRNSSEFDRENENDAQKPVRAKKKAKKDSRPARDRSPLRAGTVEINQNSDNDSVDSVDEKTGLRRGRRTRYRPLDWWRLERVEYGRGYKLAEIKRIVTLPKPPVKTLGGRKRANNARKPPSTQENEEEKVDKGKGRAKSRGVSEDIDPDVLEAARMERWNPEEGWDHDTQQDVVVWNYAEQTEQTMRIAFTEAMLNLEKASKDNFLYQRVFNDKDFLAAGILEIPAESSKPSRSSKDNTYVFFVVEGAVSVLVHRTPFYLCQGGMLLVPPENYFKFDNPNDRPARLFFCQARRGANGSDKHTEARSSVGASSTKSGRGSMSRGRD